MENQKEKQGILHDNLWGVMFRLSWPAVVAMVLYGMNTVFDAFFVGRYVGETALAGVSLAYPLTQVSLGLGSLVGVGAGSALSIALGANDRKTQERLLGNANYCTLVSAVLLTGLGLVFSQALIRMMGGTGQALSLGNDYFRITLMGSVFWIAGLAGNMIVRAEGRMKSAAVMMGFGLIVNIVANYILIVQLGWGVKGAAWGTNLGMLVYTLAAYVYFRWGRASFPGKPVSIRRDAKIVKSILSMGIPSLIMTVMSLVQAIVVMNALSRYGTNTDLAFYGVTYRIFTFLLTPIFGLMRALQPVVGINFGAKQYDRVISSFKIFAVASVVLILPFWIVMMAKPEGLLALMMPAKTLIASDLFRFRIFMSLLPILPVIFMSMTFFPAINNGRPATVMGISRQLLFYVPVMLVLPRFFGIQWVYLGSFMIDIVISLWVAWMVRREFQRLRGMGSEEDFVQQKNVG